MINTLPGMEKPVLDEIAQLPGVVSVEGVYGEFDLIVRVEVPVAPPIGGRRELAAARDAHGRQPIGEQDALRPVADRHGQPRQLRGRARRTAPVGAELSAQRVGRGVFVDEGEGRGTIHESVFF